MSRIDQHVHQIPPDLAAALAVGGARIHAQREWRSSAAWRDWLGVAASILCAIHCAAMPFVIGLLPLLGLGFFADPAFHQWMVALCLSLAVLAFVPGWLRHRRLSPVLMAVGGVSAIAVAAFAGGDTCCPVNGTAVQETDLVSAAPADSVANRAADTGSAVTDAGLACTVSACSGCSSKVQATETAERAVAAAPVAAKVSPVEPAAVGPVTVDAAQRSVFRMAWPWVTPLGGGLLVVAHLRNRYWSCRCDCAGC